MVKCSVKSLYVSFSESTVGAFVAISHMYEIRELFIILNHMIYFRSLFPSLTIIEIVMHVQSLITSLSFL